MDASADKRNKFAALGFTVGFHAVLLLLLFLIVFITPIPPFEIKPVPEIEIGLGMEGLGNEDAGGSGQKDKDIATSQDAAVSATTPNTAPNIVTDESETDVSVKTNPAAKNDTKAEEVVEEPKPSSELLNALAKLKTKQKHDGKGEGDGNTGGSGNGTKQGVGDGDGTGHGNGTPGFNGPGGYDLKGRSLVKRPEKLTDATEEGIVVVLIIVDENGKVIKAEPGQRGSTTQSANLYAKARQAALTAKFNPSPDGAKEQRGVYTFIFTLE
jgi:periplasmic protein TonB